MAKKKKNDDIESDTDPIGMKPKRKGKPKDQAQLADLILEGRENVVTVHGEPPKKKRRWLRWGLIGFGVLMVLSVLFPAKPKDTSTPQAQQVAMVTNTPRPSITPIIRETITAEALASMVAFQTQNAPTQTAIVEYVIITATLSEADEPTETGVPTYVPLPTATAVIANVAVIMVTNTTIPSATNTHTMTPTATITNTPTATITPTNTPTPTQSGVRVVSDTGVVTGQSVRVRACASTDCAELNRLFNGVTFPITGSVADGQSIEGNRVWYQIEYEGQVGYVSATLVGLVSAQPVSPPVGQNVSPVQPTQPIVAPVSNWSCSGNIYNCPDFGSGGQFTCQQLYEYMSACPNDPSKLDRENDGRFCENQCG